MINFLHTFSPQPILWQYGWLTIHWYSLFLVLGIVLALIITTILAKKNGLDKEKILDLAFWLIVGGILGARIYDVFLELPYYLKYPFDVFKIWQGGLAIHGAILGGLIVLLLFVRKEAKIANLSFSLYISKLLAIIVPGLALGQAIGRWGNYFNQELFGLPTNSRWGIPIDFMNRPDVYLNQKYFVPTFLLESLGCLIIFIILMLFHYFLHKVRKKDTIKQAEYLFIALSYFIFYSVLRFSLEFIRSDKAPMVLGLRWPQIMSLLIIITVGFIFKREGIIKFKKKN